MLGFCHELGRDMEVNRDNIDSSTFSSKSNVKGLIDCKYAAECSYYKENKKCELEK